MSTISVEKRTERGKKMQALRKQGKVPAVFYGPKDKSESILISRIEFDSLLKKEGESSVVTLKGDGIEKDVLIQEVQTHPVTEFVEHVDFYVIDKSKKVEVSVPIEFVGDSPAVKAMGGTLVKVLHEVEIEVLPMNIPQEITVDISKLVDFESIIYAGDLELPEGVTLITNPEDTIVLAEEASEEEPEEEEETSIEDIERVGEKEVEDEETKEEADAGK